MNLERRKILFDFGYHFFFSFSFFFFVCFAASAAFVFHPHLSFLLFLPLLSLHLKTTKKKPISLFASDYIGVISANHVILSCSFGEVYLFFIFIFFLFNIYFFVFPFPWPNTGESNCLHLLPHFVIIIIINFYLLQL